MSSGGKASAPGHSAWQARAGSAEMPLFPLNTVLFPGGPLPLRIFEPRYVDMVRACMREGAPFGVVMIKAGREVGAGAVASMATIGTAVRIVDFDQLPDGLLGIVCEGAQKIRVDDRRVASDGLNVATITWLPAEAAAPIPSEHAHLAQLLRTVLPKLGNAYSILPTYFDDAGWVSSRLVEILPLTLTDKQECLELDDPLARLERIAPFIQTTES